MTEKKGNYQMLNDRRLLGSRRAEEFGAMAGLRHAEALNQRIANGASIMYDVLEAARIEAKKGVRTFVGLADKIAYEHCFMATFRENFLNGELKEVK